MQSYVKLVKAKKLFKEKTLKKNLKLYIHKKNYSIIGTHLAYLYYLAAYMLANFNECEKVNIIEDEQNKMIIAKRC